MRLQTWKSLVERSACFPDREKRILQLRNIAFLCKAEFSSLAELAESMADHEEFLLSCLSRLEKMRAFPDQPEPCRQEIGNLDCLPGVSISEGDVFSLFRS